MCLINWFFCIGVPIINSKNYTPYIPLNLRKVLHEIKSVGRERPTFWINVLRKRDESPNRFWTLWCSSPVARSGWIFPAHSAELRRVQKFGNTSKPLTGCKRSLPGASRTRARWVGLESALRAYLHALRWPTTWGFSLDRVARTLGAVRDSLWNREDKRCDGGLLSSSVKVLRHSNMRLALLVVVSLLLVAAAQGEGAARAVKDDEISLSSFFSSIYGFFQSGFNSMFGSAKGSKNAKPVTDKKVNYRRFVNTFYLFLPPVFSFSNLALVPLAT